MTGGSSHFSALSYRSRERKDRSQEELSEEGDENDREMMEYNYGNRIEVRSRRVIKRHAYA